MDVEKRAIDTILQHGIEFKVPKRSILRFIGKKERTFLIRPSTASTLFILAGIALEIDFSEESIQANPIREVDILVRKHIKKLALYCSAAILDSSWKYRLFGRILALYLFKRLSAKMLLDLSLTAKTISNAADFMNSIRLISGGRISQKKETKNLSPEESGG